MQSVNYFIWCKFISNTSKSKLAAYLNCNCSVLHSRTERLLMIPSGTTMTSDHVVLDHIEIWPDPEPANCSNQSARDKDLCWGCRDHNEFLSDCLRLKSQKKPFHKTLPALKCYKSLKRCPFLYATANFFCRIEETGHICEKNSNSAQIIQVVACHLPVRESVGSKNDLLNQ